MKKSLLPLTETALLIALATVLELIFENFIHIEMPQGGGVSLAGLPIILAGYRHGYKYGLVSGLCFGIINFMLGGFWFHWGSIFFDYLLPFTALGLTGFFQKSGQKNIFMFIIGIIIASFVRYVFHSLSGVLFFQEYAIEAGYGNAIWFYSFIVYNLGYNLACTILCIVCGCALWPFLVKKNQDLE